MGRGGVYNIREPSIWTAQSHSKDLVVLGLIESDEFQEHRLQGSLHSISTGSTGMRVVSTWA